MIYAFQLYYLVCTLFLAGKDADSYLLKDRRDNPMSYARVKRWHRDGLVLAILFVVPCLNMQPIWGLEPARWWQVCVAAFFLRLTAFDLPFNRWASLPPYYLGGTAWADGIFVKIFGQNGGLKKTLTFLLLLIGLNLLNHFYL